MAFSAPFSCFIFLEARIVYFLLIGSIEIHYNNIHKDFLLKGSACVFYLEIRGTVPGVSRALL
jgi:hypothetical protein